MHELSIALAILDAAGTVAEHHAGRVCAIHVRVGKLSGVVGDALLSAYDLAREGTPLSAARLQIEEVPVLIYCSPCASEAAPRSVHELVCPACGTPASSVVAGRELEVIGIEIEE